MQKKFFSSFAKLGIFTAYLGIVFDQLTKSYVLYELELARSYENGQPVLQSFNHFIEVTGFFNIVLVWNYGVSFGMFNNGESSLQQTVLLCLLTLTIVGVILYMLFKAENRYTSYAYGLIIGGALGNLIDRFRYGAVVDFLDFHAFGHHWPAFNIADSIIFIGVLLLVLEGFLVKNVPHEK